VNRTWGIFLIPRDKAPDEGFLLCHTPASASGKRKARWRAWWLPLQGDSKITGEKGVVPEGPHYRAAPDINILLDTLIEDHVDDILEVTRYE
jgi:hypothetical protein